MTRRLTGGPPGGGGVGVSSIVSSDGSIEVSGTADLDISLRALGGTPNETVVVSDESDFPAPVGGIITVTGRYKITGIVAISPGITFSGPNGGTAAMEGAAGVEACGLTGDVATAFVEGSITLQNVHITNVGGDDLNIFDTANRTIHLRLVTSSGAASGNIGTVSGGIEIANFVQDGAGAGLIFAASYGGMRIVGGNFLNVPASFVAYEFTDTATIQSVLHLVNQTFTTTSATQFGFRLDDAMSAPDGSILMVGNATTGLGSTLDEGPGFINKDDSRIIASANADIADWLGKVTAEFFDSATPISFAPNGSIAVFDVVPSENVGATTVLVELTGSRNFRLVRNSIQDYFLEYIGTRNGVTADVSWVLTHTKGGTQRLTAAKLTVDRAPITGIYVDIDGDQVSRRDFQISSTVNPTSGVVSTEVSPGDRFTFEIASVSSDSQIYSTIQLSAETR